jgi:hypothetical protein
VAVTVPVYVIRLTVLSWLLTTYTTWPSGLMATAKGWLPTVAVAVTVFVARSTIVTVLVLELGMYAKGAAETQNERQADARPNRIRTLSLFVGYGCPGFAAANRWIVFPGAPFRVDSGTAFRILDEHRSGFVRNVSS